MRALTAKQAKDANERARVSIRWTARRVARNGTDQTGSVWHAWPQPDGSVGLYVLVDGTDGQMERTDSEHWTIVRER
jgi:hypothetical protein